MITVHGLGFRHPGAAAPILTDVTFTVERGRVTSILGPNGSGKTTLFNCINGVWKPREGAIRYDDTDLVRLSPRARARIVAVVPQDHEPPFPYSVLDVVLMGRVSHLSMIATPSKADRDTARATMAMVGIAHLAGRPYTKISGGERQLALVARALAQDTPVMVLDEPTSHLDYRNQLHILNTVRTIVEHKGITVLMTLHDPNLAMLYSDSVALMNSGRIIAAGNTRDILTEENLQRLYGIETSVFDWNGIRVVHPGVKPWSV